MVMVVMKATIMDGGDDDEVNVDGGGDGVGDGEGSDVDVGGDERR